MSFESIKSRNCLFLICPTDHIESVLTQKFNWKTYFYMALGASFSWDVRTQKNLISFIENQQIDQIVFVAKFTNRFYQETLNPNNSASFRVNKTLLDLEQSVPLDFMEQSYPISRLMLLASRHLQKQQKSMLDTFFLGKILNQKRIPVTSLVYHPRGNVFYTPRKIEQKALLYGKLSLN
ncbi:hypothetical protein [Aquimarina sediminis]|uniref:hypothetical protein n=1 Tax=Aquimarina sediminis TaxID=2070536 RepID=UPI000CA05EC1|nr:hypothetical protein [Aquimarina sediminis]